MNKIPAADLNAFQAELVAIAKATNDTLDALLPMVPGPEGRVIEAMRYSALDGGKRLRPFLACASGDLFDVPRGRSLRAAAAVEMVHCYSLVHDDLPAMDDDDLRRGRPTVHKKFDEATAILAGDALLTEAFAVLAEGWLLGRLGASRPLAWALFANATSACLGLVSRALFGWP